jgi:hypothetical protein
MGETRIAYTILMEKCLGWNLLVRPGRRWVDTIKIDLEGMG